MEKIVVTVKKANMWCVRLAAESRGRSALYDFRMCMYDVPILSVDGIDGTQRCLGVVAWVLSQAIETQEGQRARKAPLLIAEGIRPTGEGWERSEREPHVWFLNRSRWRPLIARAPAVEYQGKPLGKLLGF